MLDLSDKKMTVWVKSLELVKLIYELTDTFPKEEKYGMISQLRRASVSVASNISEGASRRTHKERTRFYEIARSSLVEVDTQIELSLKLNYLTKDDIMILNENANEVFAMLSAMVNQENETSHFCLTRLNL